MLGRESAAITWTWWQGWLGLVLLALVAADTMVFTMTVVRSAALGRAAEAGGLPYAPRRQKPPHGACPGV